MAAGFLQDGHEGAGVPRIENGVEHDVGAACGNEGVAIAIAPCAFELGGAMQVFEGVMLAGGGESAWIGVEKRGVGECGGGGNLRGAGFASHHPPRAAAVASPDSFGEGGEIHDAENGFAAMFDADHHTKDGNAADEGLRAVDGIEPPACFGVGICGAEFFAEDAVLRIVARDGIAQELFALAIGDGDGGGIAFRFDAQFGLEMAESEAAGVLGEAAGEIEHFGERERRHG